MLAVIGFHRSLTSVVAHWMHNSGVCMGDYLMPPAPSNPDGHYEDMPLVALHDDLLGQQGATWQFSGEVSLSPDAGLEVLQRYVALRDSLHGRHWGMKDPRQCLFLPNWHQVLGERGQYLVILRHWSASIQSLLKRSAQDMALGLGATRENAAFWQDYGHAARIWIAYNEALLEFLEQCPPKQRLVVTQQAVMHGLVLPDLVESYFAIPLQSDTVSPIKPGLVHDEVDESLHAHLTEDQVDRMEAIWDRLLSFAAHRAEHESPRWVAGSGSDRDRRLAYSILAASPYKSAPAGSEAKGKVAITQGETSVDLSVADLSVRANRAYRTLLLLDAERYTREVLYLNPCDVASHVRLACIFLVSGQLEAGESVLSSAIERLGEVPLLLHFKATVLDLRGRTGEAVALLNSASATSELLQRHRIAFMLKGGQPDGRLAFEAWARNRSSSLEAWQKTARALTGVEHPDLRKDLAFRVASVWNR